MAENEGNLLPTRHAAGEEPSSIHSEDAVAMPYADADEQQDSVCRLYRDEHSDFHVEKHTVLCTYLKVFLPIKEHFLSSVRNKCESKDILKGRKYWSSEEVANLQMILVIFL
ncbi:hypothetical protein CDAR_545831 [Caerostris darwini]|uniref:Uncharacterized protein n=1 Tax=Caerostris darwini TaxID=1538125 RepID=A0AAV4WXA4_9ARAC|nr:hypothetical protein CDAR_545831 [Caerostris darwini]